MFSVAEDDISTLEGISVVSSFLPSKTLLGLHPARWIVVLPLQNLDTDIWANFQLGALESQLYALIVSQVDNVGKNLPQIAERLLCSESS